ncbi:MAG: hypothetical protein FWG11_00530 [Promicromonosporaceae bacterium]|nr:hypothetical protein [Promicromonosporaceae bacterium]
MPTTLTRTQVSHTPRVQHALDVARRRWPGTRPAALIAEVLEDWARQAETAEAAQRQAQISRRLSLAGKYTDIYGPGYLDKVREGWAE